MTQVLPTLACALLLFNQARAQDTAHVRVVIDDVVDGILAAGRSECFGEAFLLLGPEARYDLFPTVNGFESYLFTGQITMRYYW